MLKKEFLLWLLCLFVAKLSYCSEVVSWWA